MEGEEKPAEEYCEFSKELNILIKSGSIRECANHSSCPKEVFSNSLLYKKCSCYLEYKRDGPPTTVKPPIYKPKDEQQNRQPYVPKFTNIQCSGCQYKASSYCWGQCSFNVWKKKSEW